MTAFARGRNSRALVGPDFQCGFEKQIDYLNHHLLCHAGVSHPDCVDDSAMILQLESPRTGVQVLGESPNPGESVQRYDDPSAGVPKKGIARLFEKAEMKPLDLIDHLAQIILFDGLPHVGQDGFKVVERQFLFDNKPRRQSLQRATKLVNLDDLGIAQFEDSGAAPVSLGYEALIGKDVQRLSN